MVRSRFYTCLRMADILPNRKMNYPCHKGTISCFRKSDLNIRLMNETVRRDRADPCDKGQHQNHSLISPGGMNRDIIGADTAPLLLICQSASQKGSVQEYQTGREDGQVS